MASFVASRTSRAARAARFGDDSHTLKANASHKLESTLQAEMAALKKANPADAGPVLLRLLQSVEFHNYAIANGVAPSEGRDCVTYMYNGVFIVDTPTRPTSPITPELATKMGGELQESNLLVREGPEGSSPFSTHSNVLGLEAPSMDVDILGYLKGLPIIEPQSVTARVRDPRPLMHSSAAAGAGASIHE